jgi:pimeloyl-ACP methyl ester carboxylesterase
VDALVLAGLPAASQAPPAGSWEEELDARTSCPAHRARLTSPVLRRGALYEPVPAGWPEHADLDGLRLPILGIHGGDDPISPLEQVRGRYAGAPRAELVSITAGRHDVLNDQSHRTVAATVVLFLERIRQEAGPRPIAVWEQRG